MLLLTTLIRKRSGVKNKAFIQIFLRKKYERRAGLQKHYCSSSSSTDPTAPLCDSSHQRPDSAAIKQSQVVISPSTQRGGFPSCSPSLITTRFVMFWWRPFHPSLPHPSTSPPSLSQHLLAVSLSRPHQKRVVILHKEWLHNTGGTEHLKTQGAFSTLISAPPAYKARSDVNHNPSKMI